MSAPLSKKQQKALEFRQKQKTKKRGLPTPEDVPEHDLEDDEDIVVPNEEEVVGPSKKRRRTDLEEGGDARKEIGKGKGKGKGKSAWDEEVEGEDAENAGKKSKKEIKQRFILFVGNLDFKTTRADVQAHFKDAIGHLPSVRLLTTKATPDKPSKSRGIAFLELPTSEELQACLKLHHSVLNRRRINVELTAGGGGTGEARKGKIKGRNERVGGQRERKAEREKEEVEGAAGAGEGEDPSIGQGGIETKGGDGKTKIRGGRRVKVKQAETGTASQPSSGEKVLPGWAKRTASTAPRPNGRRGFGLTGANAVVVG